ncbi:MAG TPA: AAA family ATPase [Candidatus Limnocylindrales bacterium]|nr:AAA family ATPase [Candidatus Limnocylindrales bacterium]
MEERTSVVGRLVEQAAIAEALEDARRGSLRAVALIGEPGIGKSRLLGVAEDAARERGFAVISVSADEELRGPFLLARTLLRSPELSTLAASDGAGTALEAAMLGLSGDPAADGAASVPAAERVLLVFDRVAMALRQITGETPIALLLDDLQWADDDSLRLLRYIVRTSPRSPLFMCLAVRQEASASTSGALALIADLERMRVARRLGVSRLSLLETRQLLTNLLGGEVLASTVETIHTRSEGVPFFAEELVRALREQRILRRVDDAWRIVAGADHLVPESVQALVERRVARLPEATRAVLADAAVLGSGFGLAQLESVTSRVGDAPLTPEILEELLAPAVSGALVTRLRPGAGDDYAFTHNQVREVLADGLNRQRRRAIHAALVEILSEEQAGPAPAAMIAHHAFAAGQVDVGIRASMQAAQSALAAYAPEEGLRIVDAALGAATSPRDRVTLLRLRDDALGMLARGPERAVTLAQLAALAEALEDHGLALEVVLRRAAAARLMEDWERAAELAREGRAAAVEHGDRRVELAACLELGQALLHSPIGEGYMLSPTEEDLDGAEEAYGRAAALARELRDDLQLATAVRELGLVENGRGRIGFLQLTAEGTPDPVTIDTDPRVNEPFARARRHFNEAIELFGAAGDRRGLMSSLIGLAYAGITELRRVRGPATVYEQIRRLLMNLGRLSSESERARDEALMLYASHAYGRLLHHPDIALERGREAYEAARAIDDRMLEWLAAGGLAMTHVALGEPEAAERWLERAREAADEEASPVRTVRLETWRALVRWAAGDAPGMSRHFDRALEAAGEGVSAATRCELIATIALRSALLGAQLGDGALLERSRRFAGEALPLARALRGQHPWEAQAEAALAQCALAEGSAAEAAEHAARALEAYQRVLHLLALDVEVFLVAFRALQGASSPELEAGRRMVRTALREFANWTVDESVRMRWLGAPVQGELARLLGVEAPSGERPAPKGLNEDDLRVLRLLVSGKGDGEVAHDLGLEAADLRGRMSEVFAKLGVASRAEATVVAVAEGLT